MLKEGSPRFSSGLSAKRPLAPQYFKKSFQINSVNQRPEECGRLSHDNFAMGFTGSIWPAIMEGQYIFRKSVAEKLARQTAK